MSDKQVCERQAASTVRLTQVQKIHMFLAGWHGRQAAAVQAALQTWYRWYSDHSVAQIAGCLTTHQGCNERLWAARRSIAPVLVLGLIVPTKHTGLQPGLC